MQSTATLMQCFFHHDINENRLSPHHQGNHLTVASTHAYTDLPQHRTAVALQSKQPPFIHMIGLPTVVSPTSWQNHAPRSMLYCKAKTGNRNCLYSAVVVEWTADTASNHSARCASLIQSNQLRICLQVIPFARQGYLKDLPNLYEREIHDERVWMI